MFEEEESEINRIHRRIECYPSNILYGDDDDFVPIKGMCLDSHHHF